MKKKTHQVYRRPQSLGVSAYGPGYGGWNSQWGGFSGLCNGEQFSNAAAPSDSGGATTADIGAAGSTGAAGI